VVESVGPFDGAPQREVAGEQYVGPIERHDQETVCRPGPDSRDFGQGRLDLVIPQARP
jgi:hypothetical protein